VRTRFDEDEWVIRDRFGDAWKLTIVRRGAWAIVSPLERTYVSGPLRGLLFQALQGDFVYDVEIGRDLLSVYDALTHAHAGHELPRGYSPFVPRLPRGLGQTIKDRLLEAFERGELRIEPAEGARFIDLPRPPDEKRPDQHTAEKDVWVELVLVDTDGNPIPGVQYRVTMSNGGVREGTLNADGKARIGDLPPGSCKVEFPELDGPAWSRGGKA